MKTLSLFSVMLFAGIFSLLQAQKLESEVVENKSFDLEPFTSVTVYEDIEVELLESFSHRAEASSNFMEYLRLEVDEDGNLVIDFNEPANARFKKNETFIKLYAVNVNKFSAGSGAELEVNSRFKDDEQWVMVTSQGEISYDADCKKLNIEVNSKGSFEGKIDTDELNAQANSAGSMDLKGNAQTANLVASSKGSISASRLDAKNVNARANSKGTVSIGVSESLTGEVTSGAKINYKANGSIRLDIDQKSGGGVKEIKGIF